MNILVNIAAFCVLLAVSLSATTTKAPHVTKEHSVLENIRFHYEWRTKSMIIIMHHKCYVATLTPDEMSNIHTDAGMKAVEIRLLHFINFAKPTTSDTLDPKDVIQCTGRNHQVNITGYYIIN